MGLGERESENNSWYETSGQRWIDEALFDEWRRRVYDWGEKLGIDFDQSYQNQANAAAARINAFNAYQEERRQRLEQEAENQRLTQDLNAAVGDVNEGLFGNGEAANQNAQQMAGENQIKEGLRRLGENLTQSASEVGQSQKPAKGMQYSNTEVNLIIGSTDYGYVPAQVDYEHTTDSSISIPDMSAIDSVIDAFKKGEFRIGSYGVRIVDDTERQNTLLRAKTAEFGSGMNFLLPWAGGGGLASIGGSARMAGRSRLAAEGLSRATTALADEVKVLAENPWTKGPITRGNIIDEGLGNNLGRTFPTIDKLENGVVTSIKSLDVLAPTYKSESALFGRLKKDIDSLDGFTHGRRNGVVISEGIHFERGSKVFELALPDASLSVEQMNAINQAKQYASDLGITFRIVIVK